MFGGISKPLTKKTKNHVWNYRKENRNDKCLRG